MFSRTLLVLLCSLQALALTPDPSGQSKIGNGQHQSSIGSQCASSLDCGANGNTACCAFLPQAGGQTIGICSGCGATTQQGKQGCGFGDEGKDVAGTSQVCPASSFAQGALSSGSAASAAPAASASARALSSNPSYSPSSSSPNTNRRYGRRLSAKYEQRQAAAAAAAARPPVQVQRAQPSQLPDPSLDAGAGNGNHAQFVTGRCVSSRDCGAQQADLSQVCCASVTDQSSGQTVGVCSGSAVGSVAPKTGCGFGDGAATSAAGGQQAAAAAAAAAAAVASSPAGQAQAAGATQSQAASLPDPNLDAGRGNQQNKQFVTGACVNSKDCGGGQSNLADVCCASVMSAGQVVGVCSGSAVGNAAPKMGCGFGDGKATSAA